MRVDFSSRNPYSDGAEWKWRLKDKDDHVIEVQGKGLVK